jgi:acyl-CoA synthetase (AMP-forming)/AMP-acid ligase II
VDLDALAALNYTGGTTGMPKGCMHTQRDMIYTAAATLAVTSGREDQDAKLPSSDVMLNFLPMFWIAGENLGLIYPIFSGATLVLLARWDPSPSWPPWTATASIARSWSSTTLWNCCSTPSLRGTTCARCNIRAWHRSSAS